MKIKILGGRSTRWTGYSNSPYACPWCGIECNERQGTFLSVLFAQPYMENIAEAVPDNQPTGSTLKDSFNDAYLNFTHFGKAADDQCITDKFAFMAVTRNMAIACRKRMKFVDLYIPIHFGKENRLSRNTTSAIFITIKDRGSKDSHIDVDKMDFFTNRTKQRPIINLIHRFGVQSAGRYVPIERTKALPYPETKAKTYQKILPVCPCYVQRIATSSRPAQRVQL